MKSNPEEVKRGENPVRRNYPWLALHYLEQGDIDQAAACANSLTGLAAKTGNPIGEAFAVIVGYGVAGTRGDVEQVQRARDDATTKMEKAFSRGSGSPMTWLFDRLTVVASGSEN